MWTLRVLAAAVPVAVAAVYLRSALAAQGRLGFPMDDPYIHFQFARNLATGGGFAFNPGEPTPGATSPLWVALLAFGHVLGAPIEPLAVALGVLAASLSAWLTFDVGRAVGLRASLAFLAALAVGACGRFTWASLSGMEVCLATALSLALMLAFLSPRLAGPRRRPLALGGLAGLCVEARPETTLLALLVVALEFARPQRRSARTAFSPPLAGQAAPSAPLAGPAASAPSRPSPSVRLRSLALYAAAFAALVAPYTAFCLGTTGRPLPNTFYAKAVVPFFLAGSSLGQLRRDYLPQLAGFLWRDNPWIALLVLPGVVLWGLRRRAVAPADTTRGDAARRHDARVAADATRGDADTSRTAAHATRDGILLLWPMAYFAYALALFPRHFNFSRYAIPLLPCLAIVAMEPIEWGLARLRSINARLLGTACWGILLVVGALHGQLETYPLYQANVDNILKMQVRMGEWVTAHLPARARVATNDVGAITWYGGRHCIDVMGLVSPGLDSLVLAHREERGRLDIESLLPEFLAREKADDCILFPEWFPRLTRERWLERVYEIDYSNNTGGGNQLVVYRVRGRPGSR